MPGLPGLQPGASDDMEVHECSLEELDVDNHTLVASDTHEVTWSIREDFLRQNHSVNYPLECATVLPSPPLLDGEQDGEQDVVVRMQVYLLSNRLRWSISLPKGSFVRVARLVGPRNNKLRISEHEFHVTGQFRGNYTLWSIPDHACDGQLKLTLRIMLGESSWGPQSSFNSQLFIRIESFSLSLVKIAEMSSMGDPKSAEH